jgi:hypothetical protein
MRKAEIVTTPFVARSIRVEHTGAFYHVMAPGNRGNRFFEAKTTRQFPTLHSANGFILSRFDA